MRIPKIDRVDAIPLHASLSTSFGYSQGWYDTRDCMLVRVVTDTGIVGYGEAFGPTSGTREIITERLAPRLIGKDALLHETLWKALYHTEMAAYKTFVPMAAISAIDLALWDIKGKCLDLPVRELLGGQRKEKIRAYATGHYFIETSSFEELLDNIVREALDHIAAGFHQLKLKIGLGILGFGLEHDVALVRKVREAIPTNVALMVDANYAYSAAEAIWVGRRLEQMHNVLFFEEPILPTDLQGYIEVRRALDLPIAGGECLSGRWQFEPFFSSRALSIAQPDLCMAGGITECWKLAQMASVYGIRLYPHVWGSGIALAAALQFIAALPGDIPIEYDRSENAIRDATSQWLKMNGDGEMLVPDGPGFGIDLDEQIIDRLVANEGKARTEEGGEG